MHYRNIYILILFSWLGVLDLPAQEDSLRVLPDSAALPESEPGNNAFTRTAGENDNSIEAVSYQLYLEKKWAELDLFCDAAFEQQADYYFLRVRAGVACFNLQQYRKATLHFQKALALNKGDDFAGSYLYYCYLYTERSEDAKVLSRSFSAALLASMGIKSISAVDFVTFENGFKTADSSDLYKNALFSSLGISHSINRRVFLFHSFTYYGQNEARFNVNQLQYYIKATLPLKRNWQLAAGFHLVNVTADVRSFASAVITSTYQTGGNQPGQPPPQTGTISTIAYAEQFNRQRQTSYIGAVTLTKHSLYLDVSVGATLAYLDTANQVQAFAGLALYPFKNNRLSFGGNVYLHSEDPFNKSYLALAPFVSAYLTKKLHLAFNYLQNTGPNITESTGYFVSNSVDYTTRRWSVTGSVNVVSSFWLYGTYGYEEKKHFTESFRYNYNIFVLGVKFIPPFK